VISLVAEASEDKPAPSTAAVNVGHILYVGQRDSYLYQLLREAGLRVVQTDTVPALGALRDASCLVIDDVASPTAGDGATIRNFLRGGGGVCLVGLSILRLGGAGEAGGGIPADVKRISDWLGVAEFYMGTHESATVLVERPFGTQLGAGERLYARPGGFRCLAPARAAERGKGFEEILGLPIPYGFGDHDIAGFANRYEEGRVYWQSLCPDDPNYPQAGRLFVGAVEWAGRQAVPPQERAEVVYVGERDSYLHRLLQGEGLRVAQTDAMPTLGELQGARCLAIDEVVGLTAEDGATVRSFLRGGGGACLVGRSVLRLGGAEDPGWGYHANVNCISDWLGAAEFYMGDNESAVALVDHPFGAPFRAGEGLYSRPGGFRCLNPSPGTEAGKLSEEIVGLPWGFGNHSVAAFTSRYGAGRVYWQSLCPDDPNYPQLGRLFVAAVRWAGEQAPNPEAQRRMMERMKCGGLPGSQQTGRIRWAANGHQYHLFEENTTWSGAKRRAEAMGGHLVTITSAAEEEFLRGGLVAQAMSDGRGYTWIGLYQDPANGPADANWHWVTGEPVNYTNWSPNEPNEFSPGEDYGEMMGDTGSWNDVTNEGGVMGGGHLHSFIVEWEH
jgi:hypothetical protein